MPCYQSTSLPSGVTTTGRTSYKTEAECNQACKEGACCEGTTCSVKPQCQCVGDDKKFRGVGTTCAADTCQFCTPQGVPKPNSGVGICYCYCTANGGTVPRFANVTFYYAPATNKPECNVSGSATVTLTRTQRSVYTDAGRIGDAMACYTYTFNSSDIEATLLLLITSDRELVNVYLSKYACPTGLAAPNDREAWAATFTSDVPRLTSSTGLGSGLCFSRFAGASETFGPTPLAPTFSGLTGTLTLGYTINGFQ